MTCRGLICFYFIYACLSRKATKLLPSPMPNISLPFLFPNLQQAGIIGWCYLFA